MEIKVILINEIRFSIKQVFKNLKERSNLIYKHFLAIVLIIIIIKTFILNVEPLSQSFKDSFIFCSISNNIESKESIISLILFLILIFFIFVSLNILTLSYQEYQNIHYQRQDMLNTSHRMTIKEVFENENRKKIIEIILEEPGIHYNSLMRKANIAPGQLQWHLNVLINFEIIIKKKVESFLVFFASIVDDPSGKDHLILIKSKVTLNIFTLIETNPGITLSDIVKELNKPKSTIKYNIDKLRKKKLISYQQQGRRKLLFANNNLE